MDTNRRFSGLISSFWVLKKQRCTAMWPWDKQAGRGFRLSQHPSAKVLRSSSGHLVDGPSSQQYWMNSISQSSDKAWESNTIRPIWSLGSPTLVAQWNNSAKKANQPGIRPVDEFQPTNLHFVWKAHQSIVFWWKAFYIIPAINRPIVAVHRVGLTSSA